MVNRLARALLVLLLLLAWLALPRPAEAARKTRKQLQQFRVAPLRVWGNTGFSYNREMVDGKKPVANMQTITNVSADKSVSGYLWKPWMVRWSSGLGAGFNTNKSNTELREDGASAANPSALSRSGNGNVNVAFFPVSRFPVNLVYTHNVTDNSEGSIGGTARRNTKFGLSQSFRSEAGGDWNGTVDYERLINVTGDRAGSGLGIIPDLKGEEGRDVNESYRSTFNLRLPDQILGYTGSYDHNEVKKPEERYTLRNTNLVVTHDWNQSSHVALNNMANLGINRINTEPSGSAVDTNAQSIWRQYSNTVSWRSEKEPVSVVASSRAFRTDIDVSDPSFGRKVWNANQNVNTTLSTNYQLSSATALGAVVAGSLDTVHSPESYDTTQASTQSLNWNYSPLQLDMGEYSYRWNMTAAASNSIADQSKPRLGANEGLSHSLTRTFKLSEETRLVYSASESANAIYARKEQPGYNMNHTVSSLLSNNEAADNSLANLSLSESRSFVNAHGRSYISNLQLSRTNSMSETESVTANMTFQWSWMRDELAETYEDTSSSLDLNYQNRELFSIPMLRLTSRMAVNNEGLVPLIKNGVQEGYTLSNRLEYQIGLLTVGMTCDLQETIQRRVGPQSVLPEGALSGLGGQDINQEITAGRSVLYMLEVRRFFNQVF